MTVPYQKEMMEIIKSYQRMGFVNYKKKNNWVSLQSDYCESM